MDGVIKKYQHAEVKFNGGTGALLCSGCRIIIDHGFNHKDMEQYCSDCEDKDGKGKQAKANEQDHIRSELRSDIR